MAGPFLGRTEELDAVVSAVRSGRQRGAVIRGAMGVGKSRLADECAAHLERFGHPVVYVRGSEAATPIQLGAVAHLLPALGHQPAGLAELIAGGIASVAEQRNGDLIPIVVVDDAPDIDAASIELVAGCVTGGVGAVIATGRSERRIPDPLFALWRSDLLIEMTLGPLSNAEADQMLDAFDIVGAGEAARSRVIGLALGNPLFLRELALGYAAGLRIGDAPLLVDLVDRRIARLAEADRRALEYIAIGEPLAASVLEDLVGIQPLVALEKQGLLRRRRGAADPIVLDHPVYQEVLQERLGAARRRVLYRDLAIAAARHPPSSGDELAQRVLWALEGGVDVASDDLAAAAMHALGRFDIEQGGRLAEASIAQSPSSSGHLALGLALTQRNSFDEAEPALRDAVRMAENDGETVRAVAALARLLLLNRREVASADALIRDALTQVSDHPSRQALEEIRWLGAILGSDLDALVRDGTAELARVPPEDRWPIQSPVATALIHSGRTRTAAEFLATIEDVGSDADTPAGRLTPMFHELNRIMLDLWTTGPQAAEQRTRAALGRAVNERAVATTGSYLYHLVLVLLAAGRVARAVEVGHESLDALRPYDAFAAYEAAEGSLACALVHAGDVAAAASLLARWPVPCEEMDNQRLHTRGPAHAYVAARSGDGGIDDVMRIAGTLLSRSMRAPAALTFDGLVVVEPGLAASGLQDLRARTESPVIAALADRASATQERSADGLDAASRRLEEFGWMLHAAEAAASAAVLLDAGGLRQEAERLRNRASRLARLCAGAQSPLLDGLTTDVLTKREREITRLAADCTNAEIADRLSLSIRTVESHLSAAYRKLGVTGRDELPAES